MRTKHSHDTCAACSVLRPIAAAVMLACGSYALANPGGPQVAAGAAAFKSTSRTLTVTNVPGTIINWQSFSIGAAEHTRFQQQSSASAVLNRVVGQDASSILGNLTSNGRVFLVNPHGIIFGAGARIDTAGFIASTLNIADKDFLQGRFKFEGGGHGVLRNEGAIRASGDIMLVGPAIENAGLMRSENGSVLLAAGKSVTITSPDAQGVRFDVQAPADRAVNIGTIEAASAAAVFAGTLVHSGDIRATTAAFEGGRVVLSAQSEAIVQSGGVVSASGATGGKVVVRSADLTDIAGRINATAAEGRGGSVQLLGHRVGVQSGASVDVSGKTGGGSILVGGDYQGRNPGVQNAWRTYVGPDSTLRADAVTDGGGGKVIIWADDATRVQGNISARGGAQQGDGGFVETSGKRGVGVVGAHVDTRAPNGRAGTWLLDPDFVVVANGGPNQPQDADQFADPLPAAVIAPEAINDSPSNVVLQANGDITFSSPVELSVAGVGLTAQAGRSIQVNANITSNDGNIELIANDPNAPSRVPGTASLTMARGTTIDAGTADAVLRMGTGDGVTPPSGDLTLSGLAGANIRVIRDVAGEIVFNSGAAVNAAALALGGSGLARFNAGDVTLNTPVAASVPIVISGATVNFNGGADSPVSGPLMLSSGTLGGSGRIAASGGMTWTGGTVSSLGPLIVTGGTVSRGTPVLTGRLVTDTLNMTSGSLQVAAGAQLALTSVQPSTIRSTITSATLINDGTVELSGSGDLVLNAGSSIQNNGLFDIQADASVQHGAGAAAAFDNNGTLRKSAGADTSAIGPATLAFSNAAAAVIEVDSGTLAFTPGTFAANSGTVEIALGATLATGALTNSGTVGGSGTLDLAGATLTNNGTLRPGTPAGTAATLSIAGDLQQGASGRIDIRVAGVGPAAVDRLAVSGAAALAGTLDVSHLDGTTPSSDSTYVVLTAYTFSGDFTSKNFPAGYETFYSAGLSGAGEYRLALGDIVNRWAAPGSGTWETAANWSLGHRPATGEDALIPDLGEAGPTATVTVSNGRHRARRVTSSENLSVVSGASLTLGPLESTVDAEFSIAGGTVILNGPISANSIVLSGGVLSTAPETLPRLTMTGGFLTRSTGGDLTITGPFDASGGFISLSSPADRFVTAGISTITARAGDPITSVNDWVNSGRLELSGPVALSGANFTNAVTATLNVNTGGTMNLAGARFDNIGTLNINTADGEPFGTLQGTGMFNVGTLNKNGPELVDLVQPLSNMATGRINVNAGTLSVDFGGTQSGRVEVGAGAQLNTDGTLTNVTGATLGGGGRINLFGSALINEGSVRPGRAGTGGTLTVDGSFTNSGTLDIVLRGQDPGGFGQLNVTGAANLGGALALSTAGRDVRVGDTFRIVTAPMINGDFTSAASSFTGGFNVLRRPDFYLIGLGGPDVNSWISDTNGAWNDSSRWSLGHAPLATERVFVRRPTNPDITVPAAGTSFEAASLQSTADIFVSGSLGLADESRIDAALSIAPGGDLHGAAPVAVRDLSLSGTIASTGGVSVSRSATLSGSPVISGRMTAAGDLLMVSGGTLDVAAGGVLSFTGTGERLVAGARLSNSGRVDLNDNSGLTIADGAVLENFGRLTLAGGSRLVLGGDDAATLVNRGLGTIVDASTSATPIAIGGTTPAGKSFANAGTFTKGAGSADVQRIDVPVTNTGTFDVLGGTLVLTRFPNNSGVIDLASGATLSTANAPLSNGALGLLKGNGTLEVGDAGFTNNGTVAPGASPGTLTVAGNYVQGRGGTLLVELGGSIAGTDFDVLRVTGRATLGGTLVVTRTASAPMIVGSAFEFMSYASAAGDFAGFSVPSGFAFQTAPGPTSYSISNTVAPPEEQVVQAQARTQNAAIVLSERAFLTATPDNTNADAERRELAECR